MSSTIVTLRRVDQEIAEHRQWIAKHQLAIVDLENTRITLLMLAERDETRVNGHASGDEEQRLLAAPDKPVIAIREVKREEPRPGRGRQNDYNSVHRRHSKSILSLLELHREPVSVEFIIKNLGLGHLHGKQRQPVYQALYQLRKDGLLIKPDGESGVYQIAPQ